ncbi:MAG: tetratricopeptide repeat protein [Candidatus Gastranaerophilaceae bacterium]|jgi:tetratricopeptide (TPR) repeat protein
MKIFFTSFLIIFLNLFCITLTVQAESCDQVYARGYGLFARNNFNAAQKTFENALIKNPDFAPFYDGLGDIYLKKGDFYKASRFYKIASEKIPDNDIYKVHMYNVLYISSVQKINKTSEDFNGAIKNQITNPIIMENISKIYEGKYKDLRLITNLYSDDKNENIKKGNDEKYNGQFENALKYYVNSASASENSLKYKAYNNIGLLYLDKNNTENALYYFKKAILDNPKSAYAYNNTGVIYLSQKDYKNARKFFNDALKNCANYSSAYNNRAVLDIRETMAFSQIYANILTNLSKNDLENLSLLKITSKFQDLIGNSQKAVNLLKPVEEKIIYNSEMLSNYGFYLYKSANYNEAEAKIKKAVQLYPTNEKNYLLLARIYEKTNNSNKVTENYEKAISQKTDFSEAFYYYGKFLATEGNFDESKKYLKRFVDIAQEQPCTYVIKYSLENENNY